MFNTVKLMCLALIDWSPSYLRAWMADQAAVFKEEEVFKFKGFYSLHCILWFNLCFASICLCGQSPGVKM